jgi:hypothetical protein
MQDYEFETLKVRASVTPQSENWPSGDVKVSIMGNQPTIKGELHWSTLHDCVSDARNRVLKTFGAMAAIDEDRNLSPTGKADKKREIATKAIADLERSKSLAKAQAAVEHQVTKWNEQLRPKAPESVGDAMLCAEIRSHLAALKPEARLSFIDNHTTEVAQAVLSAPAFLSGLSPAELGVLKQRIEARANPAIAEAKAETLKALQQTEAGWRAAIQHIRERGGLPKGLNGAEEAA